MLPLQLRRGATRRAIIIICLVALSLITLAWRVRTKAPRAWSPLEVPVAFWTWRDEMPTEDDVLHAAHEARARELFLRAGQFDVSHDGLRRIRAATGAFPRAL